MDKLTVNGKRYIGLGDLDEVCRRLRQELIQRTTDDEGNRRELTDEEKAFKYGINQVMMRVMEDELEDCETEDEARKVWQSLRDEWMLDRWCLTCRDDTGERLFFRKYCYHVTPEGEAVEDGDELDEGTPVFTNRLWLMMTFTDYHKAASTCKVLAKRTGIEDLEVDPVFFYFAEGSAKERLLKAIFGEAKGDGKVD